MAKRVSLLSLFFVLTLLSAFPVYAHEVPDMTKNGTITFHMDWNGEPLDGGSLSLYQVGNIVENDGNYGFSLVEEMQAEELLDHFEDPELAVRLATLAKEANLEVVYAFITAGEVIFQNVEPGLYVVTQEKNEATAGFAPINPFLISMPKYEDGHYQYEINADPKVSIEIEPAKPTEPAPPKPADPSLPQTGQLNWPVPVLVASGLALFIIGLVLRFGRKRTFFMIWGVMLLLGAGGLFFYNQKEAETAGQASLNLLPQLIEEIENRQEMEDGIGSDVSENLVLPPEYLAPEALEMTEMEIDGHAYIGFLTIPALNLELPIMVQWNYDKLKIAPCRYSGSVNGEDFVIMAHNYAQHFGRLSKLSEGDNVFFTDVNGVSTAYTVVGRDILNPKAVEEMTAGDFDLTLFTCTYDGRSRMTVYCNRTKIG